MARDRGRALEGRSKGRGCAAAAIPAQNGRISCLSLPERAAGAALAARRGWRHLFGTHVARADMPWPDLAAPGLEAAAGARACALLFFSLRARGV